MAPSRARRRYTGLRVSTCSEHRSLLALHRSPHEVPAPAPTQRAPNTYMHTDVAWAPSPCSEVVEAFTMLRDVGAPSDDWGTVPTMTCPRCGHQWDPCSEHAGVEHEGSERVTLTSTFYGQPFTYSDGARSHSARHGAVLRTFHDGRAHRRLRSCAPTAAVPVRGDVDRLGPSRRRRPRGRRRRGRRRSCSRRVRPYAAAPTARPAPARESFAPSPAPSGR